MQSKFTVARRVLHIVSVILTLYAIGFASLQFKALSTLQSTQYDAFGFSQDRLALAKHYANMIAIQWASPILQDPVEKDVLIQQWASQESVLFVAVYNDAGFILRQASQSASIKSLISDYPYTITATAPYAGDGGNGYVVITINNHSFKMLQAERTTHLTRGVFWCLVLGLIGGAYLFRGYRQLNPNTRR